MKLTPLAKKELKKRINKKVEVSFGQTFILGDGYCGKLLEFNNETMTFKGLSGLKVIPFRNVKELTLKGDGLYG